MNPTRAARHGLTLAWRGLMKLKHSPDQLLDVVGLPFTFVLMFVFLFGNSVSGDWRVYLQYVLPGIAVQALMFASLGTALALNADLRTGVFDRFRSLPIARSAPLVGHVLGDLVKYVGSLLLVFGLGMALGFRFHGGVPEVVAGFAIIGLYAFAICWLSVLLGLTAKSPEAVQGLSVVLILPLTFGSNVFVPTANLPGWLQAWVKVNPVTQVANAARALMLGQPPGSAPLNALLWTVGIVAVFAPAAVWAYGRSAR
jgi:oleandomycin transport system permease protein